MRPHSLTTFELQKFYQDEPKFNGVYSRNSLPKIKDGTYVINHAEFSERETSCLLSKCIRLSPRREKIAGYKSN